ncbi:hypothetical protein OAM67_01525 [bacterium]|nr:hypothetical protein [bacterium]
MAAYLETLRLTFDTQFTPKPELSYVDYAIRLYGHLQSDSHAVKSARALFESHGKKLVGQARALTEQINIEPEQHKMCYQLVHDMLQVCAILAPTTLQELQNMTLGRPRKYQWTYDQLCRYSKMLSQMVDVCAQRVELVHRNSCQNITQLTAQKVAHSSKSRTQLKNVLTKTKSL